MSRNVLCRRSFIAKSLTGLAAVACASKGWAAALPGKGVVVQPIGLSTPTARFQDVVVGLGLSALGYDVKPYITSDPALFHLALAQGEASYCTQGWTPLYEEYYEKSGGDALLERTGHLVTDCTFGYCIDKKTADRYGINNLKQFQDPKIAKLFNTTGVDDKADLVAGDPGWGAAKVMRRHLSLYDLSRAVRPNHGSYTALMADVIARFNSGQPVFYYSWVPMWVNAVLVPGRDVVWLSVPFPDPANGTKNTKLPDGRDSGFPLYEMRITSNRKFLTQNPAAKKFFEQIKISAPDISAENQLMQKGENTLPDIQRHARQWISSHQEQFDEWIRVAKAV
jgi:glycine betaine/proline transport system substrate-binding protein